MAKKKLPTGIQTFSKIRDPKENYVYIDKTDLALDLISNNEYVFLSRPRRFGKSLFLDTLAEIFKGSKSLFEGLAIYDKWDWSQQWPVIRISFATGNFLSEKGIQECFNEIFEQNCKHLGIDYSVFRGFSQGIGFERIIQNVFEKYNKKVVILIDEYDKLILDNIHLEDKMMSKLARTILRDFYSSIKANDAHIKFVMLTGVSKFSKLNLFSGLNNITDITLHKQYATITGYTHADIVNHFDGWLDGVDMEQLKQWYNGYNYFGEPIYNPYDILLFMSNSCEFDNYWWSTGNPSFLIELLKKEPRFLPDLENIEVSKEQLEAFDVEHIELSALLWQTGYLTFDSVVAHRTKKLYKLKVPNLEVQNSLNTLFFDYLTDLKFKKNRIQRQIEDAFYDAKLDAIHVQLVSLFASISHHNYTNNLIATYEGYYASVVYAFLASLGFDIVAEDTTNTGRIDMTIKTPDRIYIVEFKVDMPAEKAIEQCHTNRYYDKYRADEKPITLIGIQFNSEKRQIAEFVCEEFVL